MRIVALGGLFALVSVVAACGSGDPTVPETDGGAAESSPGDSATKDSGALDGAVLDASQSDGSVSDAASDTGVTATGSIPPAGATLCGSGTFVPADSMNVCQMSSPYFPPMYTVTKACGGAGFTFVSGLWEAWCTPSATYLFARFDDATGFEIEPAVRGVRERQRRRKRQCLLRPRDEAPVHQLTLGRPDVQGSEAPSPPLRRQHRRRLQLPPRRWRCAHLEVSRSTRAPRRSRRGSDGPSRRWRLIRSSRRARRRHSQEARST